MTNIATAIKYEVAYGLSIGTFRLDLGLFQRLTWPLELCDVKYISIIFIICCQ